MKFAKEIIPNELLISEIQTSNFSLRRFTRHIPDIQHDSQECNRNRIPLEKMRENKKKKKKKKLRQKKYDSSSKQNGQGNSIEIAFFGRVNSWCN